MSFGATSLIPFAASALGSLLGGKRKPSAYEQQQAALAQQQGNLANTLQGYGNQAQGDYNKYNQQSQRAIGDYADLLRQNPYTDQYSTNQLGAMTAGVNGDAQAAQSNLAAQLAQRGISDSSALTGGLTAIANNRNNAIAGARQNLYGQSVQNQYDRSQQLANLLSGTANGYRGAAESYLGQAMGGYGSAGSQYGQLAQQDYNQQNQWNQQQGQNASIYGQLGGLLAGAMTPNRSTVPGIGAKIGMENSMQTGMNPSYGTGLPVTPATMPGVPKLPQYRF